MQRVRGEELGFDTPAPGLLAGQRQRRLRHVDADYPQCEAASSACSPLPQPASSTLPAKPPALAKRAKAG